MYVAPAGTVREEARLISSLAWPVSAGQVGLISMGVVDLAMVGRLGPEPLAALGIANTLVFGTLLVGLGTAHGIDPLVAQAYGAGRDRDAALALIRGTLLTSVVGVLIILAHWYSAELLVVLGQPESLIETAATYCRILAPGVPVLLGFELLRRFLQGSGRMQPAMWAIGIGNLVNVVGDYALIYGHFGMPALGVAGAAWTTLAVRVVMLLTLFWIALPELRRTWPERLAPAVNPKALAAVAAIALPVGAQLALEVWAFNAITIMAGWLGPGPLAAHTAALNLASVTFMIPLGISAAASTRVGNLIGAGQPWRRAGWTAVGLSAVVMACSAVLLWTFPDTLGRIYMDDVETLALVATVLPLAALFQLWDGIQVSCFGVLRGAGDTQVPTGINLVGYWFFGIPLAYVLGLRHGLGLAGCWMGLAASLFLVALALMARVAQQSAHSGTTAALDIQ